MGAVPLRSRHRFSAPVWDVLADWSQKLAAVVLISKLAHLSVKRNGGNTMKLLAVFSTTALSVLLGISAPVYAQQDEPHPQEEKRAQPDEKAAHDQDKQEDKQVYKDKDKDGKQVDKEKENKHAEREEKSAHQDERAEAQGERREGKPGGRIPDDRFRANFGREHTFHIGRPVIVEGAPRFQYGGYWFVIARPWPVGWAYTDVVYVDYVDGGYYLISPVHPGVQILINVVF
jgi:hypothetical protein